MRKYNSLLSFFTYGVGRILGIAVLISIIVFGCIALSMCIPMIIGILRALFGIM
jgi:hypothetical protein